MQGNGELIVPAQSSLRDVHHIVHDGTGPGPKIIGEIADDVSNLRRILLKRNFMSDLFHLIRVQQSILNWRLECFCTPSMVRITAYTFNLELISTSGLTFVFQAYLCMVKRLLRKQLRP
jgi:hypothetical protein